jgi:hypothetical protein
MPSRALARPPYRREHVREYMMGDTDAHPTGREIIRQHTQCTYHCIQQPNQLRHTSHFDHDSHVDSSKKARRHRQRNQPRTVIENNRIIAPDSHDSNGHASFKGRQKKKEERREALQQLARGRSPRGAIMAPTCVDACLKQKSRRSSSWVHMDSSRHQHSPMPYTIPIFEVVTLLSPRRHRMKQSAAAT